MGEAQVCEKTITITTSACAHRNGTVFDPSYLIASLDDVRDETERMLWRIAVHECGHALLATLLGAGPVDQIIISQARSMTMRQYPVKEVACCRFLGHRDRVFMKLENQTDYIEAYQEDDDVRVSYLAVRHLSGWGVNSIRSDGSDCLPCSRGGRDYWGVPPPRWVANKP